MYIHTMTCLNPLANILKKNMGVHSSVRVLTPQEAHINKPFTACVLDLHQGINALTHQIGGTAMDEDTPHPPSSDEWGIPSWQLLLSVAATARGKTLVTKTE